jgi:hypothetical protein
MFGGGSRRDDGSLVINNTNVFAALDTLKKKKKSDKDKKKKNKASKSTKLESESESQVFWAPAPLNATSWADVDDEGAKPPFKALTREEARALAARNPAVSPWRVVAVQAEIHCEVIAGAGRDHREGDVRRWPRDGE